MPHPRFLHQAVLIKHENNWQILVVGGKNLNSIDNVDYWLNSVVMLDLLPYFKQDVKIKGENGVVKNLESEWKEMAPMLSARSNFAMVALNNFVYVYGGISNR